MTKITLAYSMNAYVMNTGDEDLFDMWLGIYPDPATDEDIQFVCKNGKLWQALCITFGKIVKINENRG